MSYLRARRAGRTIVFFLASVIGVFAAAAETARNFIVPAGEARETLKRFAAQAEVEIAFPSENTLAVRTNAVAGRFTPQEAIDALLAGTGLGATREPTTGAYAVRPVASAAPSLRPTDGRRPVVRSDSGERAQEETVTLNPFVVSENDAVGYSAASTLAGTRINTALRDVGAAISIITPEFLADTASTNLGELLSLTTATEIGGVFGNFAGGATESGRPDQSESRENPQGNNRVRGIGAATTTRDYFLTDIPFDAYNSSGVTIARGPNSLLFGIGNPAGIIESSIIHPQLQRNRTVIGARFGSEDSYRATLDLNRVLVKGRFAFRVATVNEHNNYQQKPAFDRKRRGYISLEGVLRDGKAASWIGKTSVRVSGEMGDSQSNPVNVIPPVNTMLNFFQAPNPAIASIPGTGLDPRLVLGSPTYSYRPKVTVDNRLSSSAIVAANPGIGVPYFIQIPLVFDAANQSTPGYSTSNNPALAGIAGIMGRIRYAQNPNGRDAIDTFYSGTVVPTGFVAYTLQNRAIFDYRKKLISGGLNHIEQVFQVGNVAFTQELFGGRGGFELAYDQQKTRSTRLLPFSFGNNGGGSPASGISIDVARFLSNDQPNPNVGRPFIDQQGITDRTQTGTREAFRATAFYRLDLEDRGKKLFGLPLGNHVFTGLHTRNRNDASTFNYATGWTSTTRNLNTDVFQAAIGSNFRTTPIVQQYLGPSVLNANSINDVRITNVVTARVPQSGDTYNVSFFDFTNKRMAAEPLSVLRFLNGNSKSRQLIDSQSLSLKSDFLKNHLVSVVGWRWDHLRTFSSVGNRRNPDDTLDNSALRLDSTPNLDERGRNFTWSTVGRVPRFLTKKLPLGIELGGFYNSSGNFNPVNVRTNLHGQIIDAPAGTTKEYGILIEFLDRRVSLRVNNFHTIQTSSSNNAQGATSGVYAYPNFMMSRYVTAQSQGIAFNTIPGVIAAGYNSYQQLYAAFQQLHPEPTRTLNNLRLNAAGNNTLTNGIAGLTDTSDLDARGLETELVGNITPRWRVSFNVAKQETVVSGSAKLTKQVADAVYANLVKFNLLGIDQGPALPERQTAATRFASNVGNPLAATLARDGAVSPEQRKWRANFTSTYDLRGFENPILKAMSVGTSVRWQGKVAIGAPFLTGQALKEKIVATNKLYTSTSQIADSDPVMQTQFPDLDRPFYGPEELAGDVWASYRRRIFKNVDWRLQLNVRNAWGNSKDIPVTANPDGSIAVIRIPNETRWLLSSSFTF
ncbi:MAG: hypothetical protein Q8N18_11710 [Opitutaceae bacterium]|nr:hypothetical protein [Opitutaceae bacterium]